MRDYTKNNYSNGVSDDWAYYLNWGATFNNNDISRPRSILTSHDIFIDETDTLESVFDNFKEKCFCLETENEY